MLYMGGPVYIYFSDDTGINHTSGHGALVTKMPEGWDKLYPGMNISFQAKAVVQGEEFTKVKPWGDELTYYTTEAVLRARIDLDVYDPTGNELSTEAVDIYNWIWPQLKRVASNSTQDDGIWIMDPLDATEENNYFYFCKQGQSESDAGDYMLKAVGGLPNNVSIAFLNNSVIQLPPIELTNTHADCIIKFTIVFEAVQAFFPYEKDEVGVAKYQGDTTGRDTDLVTDHDVGLEKPLKIKNSRKLFEESQWFTN